MKVLVNLLPLPPSSAAGGLQNAANFWRAVATWGGHDEWLCVARPGLGIGALTTRSWQDAISASPRGLASRLALENRWLPGLAKKWGADVVFTLAGAGPLRAPVPTVVGWHDPTAAYPNSPLRQPLSGSWRLPDHARRFYASLAVRRAHRVCVQTRTMANRLSARWRIPPGRFVLVPNGPSTFLSDERPAPENGRPRKPWTVLVIGVPKPLKNFAVVPETGARLQELDVGPGRFVMTISSDREPWLESFRDALRRWGEVVPIERVGRVPHSELGPLYRDADAVFLPSLLESFSASYVEAMHFGVPLVTSAYDFAKETCGPAAEYVDPLDPADCARGLARVLTDPARRQALRNAGFERLRHFPTWEERFRLYREACASALPRAQGQGAPTRR